MRKMGRKTTVEVLIFGSIVLAVLLYMNKFNNNVVLLFGVLALIFAVFGNRIYDAVVG